MIGQIVWSSKDLTGQNLFLTGQLSVERPLFAALHSQKIWKDFFEKKMKSKVSLSGSKAHATR